jgi:amino acid transporter
MKLNGNAEKIFWYVLISMFLAIIMTFFVGYFRTALPENNEVYGLPFPLDTFFIIMFSVFLSVLIYIFGIKHTKLSD